MSNRKKRLLERRTEEKDEAARWLADHPGLGSFPGKRSETGESDEEDRFAGLSGENSGHSDHNDPGLRGHGHLSMNSITNYDNEAGDLEQWEQWHLDNGSALTFLGRSPSLTPEQLVTRAHVEHVLTFLLPDHRELLVRHHGMRETQDALAADFGISRQAIQQRLRVAEEDFRRAFEAHINDPVNLGEVL